MSSRNGHSVGYDHTLLSSVPGPTRAEKQEGYNVDLLEDGRDGRRPVSDPGSTTLDHSPGPIVAIEEASKAPYGTAEKVQPWYRRKWGIIGIAIVALLIIAGVVGGAVGGTHHNSHPHSGAINSNGTVPTGNNSTTNGTENGSNGTGSSSNSTNSTNGVGTAPLQGMTSSSVQGATSSPVAPGPPGPPGPPAPQAPPGEQIPPQQTPPV